MYSFGKRSVSRHHWWHLLLHWKHFKLGKQMAAVMSTPLLKIKYLDKSFIIVMVLSEPMMLFLLLSICFIFFVGTQIVCQTKLQSTSFTIHILVKELNHIYYILHNPIYHNLIFYICLDVHSHQVLPSPLSWFDPKF